MYRESAHSLEAINAGNDDSIGCRAQPLADAGAARHCLIAHTPAHMHDAACQHSKPRSQQGHGSCRRHET